MLRAIDDPTRPHPTIKSFIRLAYRVPPTGAIPPQDVSVWCRVVPPSTPIRIGLLGYGTVGSAGHRVRLRCEASVCAAIPVVKVLRESMIVTNVHRIDGIVNGTTNFILTRMIRNGSPYADALAEAQALGYAEADPTEDVTGADAAAKIAILASIAFHTRMRLEEVEHVGIDSLELADVTHAAELGYAVKLIASAWQSGGEVAARVHPCLLA